MSVLIKGMGMPPTPVLFCIHPDGKVFADLEGGWREYKAIPIPPHGRLIDADALMEHDRQIYRSDGEAIGRKCYIDFYEIDDAPTIIPAEEEIADLCTKGHLHLGYAEEGET